MTRYLVTLAILVVVAYAVRTVWRAVLQLRVGAIPEGVDVPTVRMVPDRGWQVTRAVVEEVAIIRVEHPTEGVRRQWEIPIREPGATRTLERTMAEAGMLTRSLSARQ